MANYYINDISFNSAFISGSTSANASYINSGTHGSALSAIEQYACGYRDSTGTDLGSIYCARFVDLTTTGASSIQFGTGIFSKVRRIHVILISGGGAGGDVGGSTGSGKSISFGGAGGAGGTGAFNSFELTNGGSNFTQLMNYTVGIGGPRQNSQPLGGSGGTTSITFNSTTYSCLGGQGGVRGVNGGEGSTSASGAGGTTTLYSPSFGYANGSSPLNTGDGDLTSFNLTVNTPSLSTYGRSCGGNGNSSNYNNGGTQGVIRIYLMYN